MYSVFIGCGRCSNFKSVISERMLQIKFRSPSCEIALRWMLHDTFSDESTLVQVMAWCCQATSHYLNQGSENDNSCIVLSYHLSAVSGHDIKRTMISIMYPDSLLTLAGLIDSCQSRIVYPGSPGGAWSCFIRSLAHEKFEWNSR